MTTKSFRKSLVIAFMVSAMLTLGVMGTFAQSLDTSAFTQAITDGMQLFFDNLPSFVLVGFAVFGVVFAFRGGLSFAKSFLNDLISGFGSGK